MTITALPLPAPTKTQSQAVFDAATDAFVGALPNMVTEINNLIPTLNNPGLMANSTTSVLIGTGSKSFTIDTGKTFVAGQSIFVQYTTTPTNWMYGTVTSYNSGTGALVVNVTSVLGSGTYALWTVSLATPLVSSLGFTMAGLINQAVGANIASAGTLNLSTATGNTVHITGTVATSAVTMNAGQWMECIADGAWPLTYDATNNNINGGASYTCGAGDRVFYFYDGTTVYGNIVKQNGSSLSTSHQKILPVTATIGSGFLTATLQPCVLDFRSATLATGTPTTRFVNAALSLATDAITASFGATTAVQTRLYLVAIDTGAATPVLGIVNKNDLVATSSATYGFALAETARITDTFAITGAANTVNKIYTTAALTGVNYPYRIVGFIDATWTTGSGWVTTPTLVQGAGGNALAAMSGLGYGQTWQDVSGSRAVGVTYYNTTGRPIVVSVTGSDAASQAQITVSGVIASYVNSTQAATWLMVSAIVPPGSSYVVGTITTVSYWSELR